MLLFTPHGGACNMTRAIWSEQNRRSSLELIELKREQISIIIVLLTAHILQCKQAERLGVPSSDFCRNYRQEEELERCSHDLRMRHTLVDQIVDSRDGNLGRLEQAWAKVRCLFSFPNSTHWFVQRLRLIGMLSDITINPICGLTELIFGNQFNQPTNHLDIFLYASACCGFFHFFSVFLNNLH